MEDVKIGFNNRLAGDPGFVDGSFEKTVSFIEQTSEMLMGGFAVFELMVKENVGSFESETVF